MLIIPLVVLFFIHPIAYRFYIVRLYATKYFRKISSQDEFISRKELGLALDTIDFSLREIKEFNPKARENNYISIIFPIIGYMISSTVFLAPGGDNFVYFINGAIFSVSAFLIFKNIPDIEMRDGLNSYVFHIDRYCGKHAIKLYYCKLSESDTIFWVNNILMTMSDLNGNQPGDVISNAGKVNIYDDIDWIDDLMPKWNEHKKS